MPLLAHRSSVPLSDKIRAHVVSVQNILLSNMATADKASDAVNTIQRIGDNLHIARNVIFQSQKESPSVEGADVPTLVQHYTGVKKCAAIDELLNIKTTTFSKYLEEADSMETYSPTVPYYVFKKAIYDEYQDKKKKLPKWQSYDNIFLIHAVNSQYSDLNRHTIEKDLKKHGFIMKRLGSSKEYFIQEKPEQKAKRMRYLYDIKQFRESGNAIVYLQSRISKIKMDDLTVEDYDTWLAVSPQLGLLGANVIRRILQRETCEEWINKTLNNLPEGTVIVVEQSPALHEEPSKVPTEHSNRTEMVEWLEENGHSYEYNLLHSCELWTLIQKHKTRFPETNKCLQKLAARGHKILFRPPELSYRTYYLDVEKLEHLQNVKDIKTDYFNYVNAISIHEWREYESNLTNFEINILDQDIELEQILDKLVENAETVLKKDDSRHAADEDYVNSIIAL